MFGEYLHRVYQTMIRGRKPRSRKVARSRRPSATRLAVEALEERTVLSTLTLTNGALVYSPNTFVANSLSMSHNSATHRYTFVDTAEDITLVGSFSSPAGDYTHTVSFGDGNVHSITVNMFNQNFTVAIEQTLANVPVTVNLGNGNDDVYVSPSARNLNNMQGAITVHGGLGSDGIEIFDESNAAAQTFNMGAGSVSRSGAATISYNAVNFLTVHAGNGNNVFNISSTALTTGLDTGDGHDTVNVNGTGFGGALQINEGTGMDTANVRATNAEVDLYGGGQDTVNVGNAGSVQAIYGLLTISDPPSLATVNVDDSADSTSRMVSLDTVTFGGSDYGRITGLAPGAIHYKYADTYTVTARSGTGGATVNVRATGAPVNLVGYSSNTTVNVGNAGLVHAINANLRITNPLSFTTVNVDDSADGTSRIVTLGTVTLAGSEYGSITGLAPAGISYKYGDTANVTVQTGSGGDTVNVRATGVPVNLIGHAGTTVNVGNAGSVQAINGPLTITNPPSFTTLNVDDSADSAARTVNLDTVTIDGSDYGRITGLALAPVLYKYADTYTVTVQTGTGGTTVNVLATGVPVNLIGHAGSTVNVGNAGNVQAINGPLTISNPPSFTTLNVDDSADSAATTVTLDTVTIGSSDYGTITGLAPAAIQYKYADTSSVTVHTGTGGATINALTTVRPVNLIGSPTGGISLFASDAINTWNITAQNAGSLRSALLAGTVTFSGASTWAAAARAAWAATISAASPSPPVLPRLPLSPPQRRAPSRPSTISSPSATPRRSSRPRAASS
jgi:hypothetical protein